MSRKLRLGEFYLYFLLELVSLTVQIMFELGLNTETNYLMFHCFVYLVYDFHFK